MNSFEAAMVKNLEGVVLGEREGHYWENKFGVPIRFYFGIPGEPIPSEKIPPDELGLTYKGIILSKTALEAIPHYASVETPED
jgi:hypothetical protein